MRMNGDHALYTNYRSMNLNQELVLIIQGDKKKNMPIGYFSEK